jgi:hypothetical protein
MSAKKSQQTSRKPPGKSTGKTPVADWRELKIQKPKMTVKTGDAKRQAEQEQAAHPPSFWGVMIRLLPVWILLIVVLILEPTLPFRAVGGAVRWIVSLIPERLPQAQSEPVFIVEGASAEALENSELPPPNWDLEIAGIFTPEVQHWSPDIARWSVTYRIKPNMIATVMQIESCGDPTAASEVDAVGLFQVLRFYFEKGEDPFDPDTNARHAMLLLGELLASANGDTGLTFAGYNGGASMLLISPGEWPLETQNYQFWASGIYEEAEMGLEQSPTLQDWLNAGGSLLCEAAAEVLESD